MFSSAFEDFWGVHKLRRLYPPESEMWVTYRPQCDSRDQYGRGTLFAISSALPAGADVPGTSVDFGS